MACNRIFSIYCSKKDCIKISKNKEKIISGIHLDTIMVKDNPSLKKTYKHRTKMFPLEEGDYVIAIDDTPSCISNIDHEKTDMIHFPSSQQFFEWLSEHGYT